MSIQNQIYILDTPPSLNKYLKRSKFKTYLSKEAIDYKQYIKNIFHDHDQDKDGFFHFEIGIHPKILKKKNIGQDYFLKQKRHDIDNITKVLFDSLNNIIYHDDKQIISLNIKIKKPLFESGCIQLSFKKIDYEEYINTLV